MSNEINDENENLKKVSEIENNIRITLDELHVTHPNIQKVWKTHIEYHLNKLHFILKAFENVIVHKDEINDLTNAQIYLLYNTMY